MLCDIGLLASAKYINLCKLAETAQADMSQNSSAI